MLGERYRVREGDSLWRICERRMGAGTQWPRVWRYNNRRDVVRYTGRGIADPDLIYPDQLLLLPIVSGSSERPRTTGSAEIIGKGVRQAPPNAPLGPLGQQLPRVQSPISIKYRLDDLKFPPIVQPNAILEMRMTGDLLLMTRRSYPALYVTQRREIELQVVGDANRSFDALVSDTRLVYDGLNNRLTYRSMLVTKSTTPNMPTSAIGLQIDSASPLPKLRYEFRIPKLEGSLPLFNYAAIDFKLVIEVTPTSSRRPGPDPQLIPVPVRPGVSWQQVAGAGLIVVGGAIVVGTLVEDFFSAGVGVADDPASFAAAGVSVARGLALLRGAAAVLPRAAAPAALSLTLSVAPARGTPGRIERRR